MLAYAMGLMFRFKDFSGPRKTRSTQPVLTDIMDTNQSSQTGHLRGGLISPIRGGRTVREYDQEIEELRKENFDLKLRLYLVEQKLDKNFSHDGNGDTPVDVDVELKVATEALKNELNYKNKLLQDAFEQAEKYEADLKELLSKNAMFQEQIDSMSKVASHNLELTQEKEALQMQLKKCSSAIPGLVQKYKQEVELLPTELRPIVLSAIQAAREKSKEKLVLAVKDLKISLCKMMCKPFGDVFDNSASSEQIKCIKEELDHEKARCKSLEKRMKLTVNESQTRLKELKKTLSEKEMALENNSINTNSTQEPLVEDGMSNTVHEELSQKIVVELRKRLLMFRQKNKKHESLDLVSTNKSEQKLAYANEADSHSQNENQNKIQYIQNVDCILNENKTFFDDNENLKDICVQIIEIMKENCSMESEIDEKLSIIHSLTAKCREFEHDVSEVQTEINNAVSREKEDKLSGPLKSNAVTEIAVAMDAIDLSTVSKQSLTRISPLQFNSFTKTNIAKETTDASTISKNYLTRVSPLKSSAFTQTDFGTGAIDSTVSKQYLARVSLTKSNAFSQTDLAMEALDSAAVSKHSLTEVIPLKSNAFTQTDLTRGMIDLPSVLKHSLTGASALKSNSFPQTDVTMKEIDSTVSKHSVIVSPLKPITFTQPEVGLEATGSSTVTKQSLTDVSPFKSTSFTKTDTSMEVTDTSTISELNNRSTGVDQSSNINELKEENCMLLCTIDQRDKELNDLKQEIANLHEQLNEREMNSTQLYASYGDEVSRLHERLACSCNVNNELMKHLQNLAIFMEELLQQKQTNSSSTENISSTSNLLTKLSDCLDQSLVLSYNLSEQLSICEGSRIFDLEDTSIITANKDPVTSHSASEEQSYQQSHSDHDLQGDNDTKIIGGRSFHMNCSSELHENITRTGKRRRWSYSMQQEPAMDIPALDNGNVVILETGENEDLVLQLNEKGAPDDVLRNSNHNIEHGAVRKLSISNSALNAQENQPRRRCWGDDFASGNVFTGENSNFCQQVGSMTFFNRKQQNSKLDISWYNPIPSSDSDIWSEPDRDVSMQRIGIDVKTSPCQLKSPSRKSRLNRDKQTTDEVSSVKSTSSHGYVKVQSCPRRRRSSGSTLKRLFVKKECKLDRQLSLLTKEYSQFTSLLDNFEEVKDLNSNNADVLGDVFLQLTELKSSIGDTTQELAMLKEKLKNGNPVSCQKCVIYELNEEVEGTIKRINSANIFQDVVGTGAENIIQKLFLEVDNLKKLLGDSLLDSTSSLSIQNSNDLSNKSQLYSDLIKQEKEKNSSLENVIKELDKQNELLKRKQEELEQDLMHEQSTFESLNNEKNELCDELLDVTAERNELHDELLYLGNERHTEEEKNKALSTENVMLNRRILESNKEVNNLKDLILKLELERDRLEAENANSKGKESSVNDLCKQLQKDLEQTRLLLQEMDIKCSQYEKELSDASRNRKEVKIPGEQLEELLKIEDKKNEILKLENDELLIKNKNLILEKNDIQEKVVFVEKRIEDLEMEKMKKILENEEIALKVKKLDHLLLKTEEQSTEIVKLQELLKNTEKEMKILKQETEELPNKNNDLIAEKNVIVEKLDHALKKIIELEMENTVKQLDDKKMVLNIENTNNLLQKIEEQSTEIMKLQQQLQKDKKQMEILKRKYNELFCKNNDLILEKNAIQDKVISTEKALKEMKIKARSLESMVKQLEMNKDKIEFGTSMEKEIEDLKMISKMSQLNGNGSVVTNNISKPYINEDLLQFQTVFKPHTKNQEVDEKLSFDHNVPYKRLCAEQKSYSKDICSQASFPQMVGTMSPDSITSNDTKRLKMVKCDEINMDNEEHLKKLKPLQAKLAVSEKRIELLEKQKSELREHFLAQVRGQDGTSIAQSNEKSDFQLQLEKKNSFINELKNDLYKTSNLLVDKQTEVDDLKEQVLMYKNEFKTDSGIKYPIIIPQSQKLDKYVNTDFPDNSVFLKTENSELKLKILELKKQKRFEGPNLNSKKFAAPLCAHSLNEVIPKSLEKNISSLKMCKWDLMRSIFTLQKQFYEIKAMRLDHYENFMKHIENLYSLQFSSSLINSQSQSEPIISSTNAAENVTITKQDVSVKNTLLNLELDIECLQNLKIFLNQFVLPIIMKTFSTDNEFCNNRLTEKIDQTSQLKSQIKQLKDDKDILHTKKSKIKQLLSMPSFDSIQNLRKCDGSVSTHCKNVWEEMTLNVSCKLSYFENMYNSLDLELETSKDFSKGGMQVYEKYSYSAKRSLLSKLVSETKILKEKVEKVSQLNSAFKAMTKSNNIASEDIQNKQDISDKESVLSDDTLTLSRSQSLSPVSFDDFCVPKASLMGQSQSMEFAKYSVKTSDQDQRSSREHCRDEKQLSYKLQKVVEAVGSSQDSVCHRSHFSSPDLGIESDPNHESSAPEQVEKDFYLMERRLTKSAGANVSGKHFVEKQRIRKPYTYSENTKKAEGDSLHAIGILQEYELLKQEVQESLVGIKSVLSRTSDGLHHIAKYTSPRKSLEYSTFKAIRDTCGNIEVCLTEAQYLINNFRVLPYPTAEEWTLLLQQNQELNDTLLNLKSEMSQQENEFKDAMKKLQHAQLLKENMERKISKKLIKTKKVLRQAKMELLEPNTHKCHKHSAHQPNRSRAESSACQGSQ